MRPAKFTFGGRQEKITNNPEVFAEPEVGKDSNGHTA